jgi:hypothetical protein
MGTLFEDPEDQAILREAAFVAAFDGVFYKIRLEEARSILHKVLAARSFQITSDVRARIDGERDLARLESWVVTAVNAGTIGDVFREG